MITIKTTSWEIDDVDTVFFDKDGTLIDSHIYWGRIIEKRSKALIDALRLDASLYTGLCRRMGLLIETGKLLPEGPIALVSREEVIKLVFQYLTEIGVVVSVGGITDIFLKVHTEFLKEMMDYVKILPGVVSLLEKIKKKGVKTAIITTDSIKNTEKIMDRLNIKRHFDLCIGKETTVEPKISGVPALIAMQSLQTGPETTVCVGDSPMDIIMCRNAHCKAGIGVALGQVMYEDLLKETRFVIHDYSELMIG